MQVDYHHHYPAPVERVWQVLLDPAVLQRHLPGCRQLVPSGDGVYEASLEIGIGPIRGAYQGRVALVDLEPFRSYRLMVEGGGGPGTVRGEAQIRLETQGDQTYVTCQGDAAVTGTLAAVGQRLLGSVARMLVAGFFKGLEQELTASRRVTPDTAPV